MGSDADISDVDVWGEGCDNVYYYRMCVWSGGGWDRVGMVDYIGLRKLRLSDEEVL